MSKKFEACVLAFILVFSVGPAYSKDDSKICEQTLDLIEHFHKSMSSVIAQGFGDNSAPRDTNRKMDINNYLKLIDINIVLLIRNDCKMPVNPITTTAYITDALKCQNEKIRGVVNAVECDFKNWSRD